MVEHLRPTDLSGVEVESEALQGATVYLFNYERSGHTKAELEALVKRLGGQVRKACVRKLCGLILFGRAPRCTQNQCLITSHCQ